MTARPSLGRARERAKLLTRTTLQRANLSIGRDPFSAQLARVLAAEGVDAVLDVGANVGQYASLLRSAGFDGLIVSVEPLRQAFAELSARASGDPRWNAVQSAVGAERGEITINVAANSYSSSVLAMEQAHLDADASSAYVGTEHVGVVTVEDLVTGHSLDPARTALKIDTQGYEEAVLQGAGDLLEAFAVVQLELSFVELYTGQRLFGELVEQMAAHGLTLWNLEPGIAGADGRLLQCDGVFVRRPAGPERDA